MLVLILLTLIKTANKKKIKNLKLICSLKLILMLILLLHIFLLMVENRNDIMYNNFKL